MTRDSNLYECMRYRATTMIARRPALYFSFSRLLRPGRSKLLDDATQIVIEGFPRSGNSFAVRAFRHVNPGVQIAHHTHAAAQVIRAVQLGVPALVLIRNPADAVRSMLVRRPGLSPRLVVRSYVEFYTDLLPSAGGAVIADFDEVARDFGDVMERVNARFGTAFRKFEHNPQAVDAIFSAMDETNLQAFGGALRPTHVPRPHPARERMKQTVDLRGSDELLERARGLYRSYVPER